MSDRDEMIGNLPLQYFDGSDYCTVKDATGGDFALTVQPNLMKTMESALRSAASTDAGFAAGFEACRVLAKQACDKRSDAIMASAEEAHEDEDYDVYERLERLASEATLCAEAIAALPAPGGATTGWQPIETAPKDGTPLLLGWPTFHPLVGHCEDGSWGELDSDFGFEPFENSPTHWMPIPPAPTITRKSQSEEVSCA